MKYSIIASLILIPPTIFTIALNVNHYQSEQSVKAIREQTAAIEFDNQKPISGMKEAKRNKLVGKPYNYQVSQDNDSGSQVEYNRAEATKSPSTHEFVSNNHVVGSQMTVNEKDEFIRNVTIAINSAPDRDTQDNIANAARLVMSR